MSKPTFGNRDASASHGQERSASAGRVASAGDERPDRPRSSGAELGGCCDVDELETRAAPVAARIGNGIAVKLKCNTGRGRK